MKKFWNWLVTSSQNPEHIALTVKGIMGTVASVFLLLSPVIHVKVGSDQLSAITDALVQSVLIGCTIITSLATIIGLWRKIQTPKENVTGFVPPAPKE